MSRIFEILRMTSPPYIVVLCLAAAAWCISHVVDDARQLRLVEQWISIDNDNTLPTGEHEAKIDIENLSGIMFNAATFGVYLVGKNNGCIISQGGVKAFPPATLQTSPKITNCSLQFTLNQLQPRNHLEVGFYYTGNDFPSVVLINSESSVENGMLLTPPSLVTFFVRYEEYIIIAIFFILLIITTLFYPVVFISRGSRSGPDQTT